MSDTVLTSLILVVPPLVLALVSVLSFLQMRVKTHVDIISVQNGTIASMGLRLDHQEQELIGLRDKQRISDENSAALEQKLTASIQESQGWKTLAEQRLKDLDGLPAQLQELKERLARQNKLTDEASLTKQAEAQTALVNAQNVAAQSSPSVPDNLPGCSRRLEP